MNSFSPMVSVVMAVHNGGSFLSRSIQSILNQTFRDFEFIIVDDGSSDETPVLLQKFASQDARIRILSISKQGQTKALIQGIQEARGKYIARQDADDVSYPERLDLQMRRIRKDNRISLIGSWYRLTEKEKDIELKWFLDDNETLRFLMISQNPFCHSSVLFPKNIYDKVGGYDPHLETGQDLDLWLKLSKEGKLAMVSQSLVSKEASEINRRKKWKQVRDGFNIRMFHQSVWGNPKNTQKKIKQLRIRQAIISFLPLSWIRLIKDIKRHFAKFQSEWVILTYLIQPRFTQAALQKILAKIPYCLDSENHRPSGIQPSHHHEEFCRALSEELWEETKEQMSSLEEIESIIKEDVSLPRLGGGGNYFLLYFLIRYLKPETVVETGVGLGYSSYAILAALERNQKGSLWSSDLPYFRYLGATKYIGKLVPIGLKHRWNLDVSGDRIALPRILSKIDKIDFFHYDSDKSYQGRDFALHTIAPKFSETGTILIDDVQNNTHFSHYMRRTQDLTSFIFEFKGKLTGFLSARLLESSLNQEGASIGLKTI